VGEDELLSTAPYLTFLSEQCSHESRLIHSLASLVRADGAASAERSKYSTHFRFQADLILDAGRVQCEYVWLVDMLTRCGRHCPALDGFVAKFR
jgi:hypothetical protein